jgi:hypothetical protein
MNPKGDLILLAKARGLGTPSFDTVQDGPPHAPQFTTTITLRGDTLTTGQGRTKRDAERVAADEALRVLYGENPPSDFSADVGLPPGASLPVYADVLSQALLVAHERTPADSHVDDVRRLTVRLYAGLMRDLGLLAEESESAT